ncbi:predicted protein [Chaetomium globosum CBS 148.51]|uniref:Uncharacterized protein n=1 Tax=Chaetomium globosum (strain ATCC 6205 / CBS 148.51 / DSM 1962 / NBRC 6347 / NRRL 1970) TaxID=306901 RepID=Q2GR36_CHAGB|nr:uncharacterized protein CHGG_09568 [Chaetomium globosum CBS 148.51]EAQ85554.1 predicted protein [Chaetomium globosum CBS 148.51]
MGLSNPTVQVDDSAGSIGWPVESRRTAAAQHGLPPMHTYLGRDGSVEARHSATKTHRHQTGAAVGMLACCVSVTCTCFSSLASSAVLVSRPPETRTPKSES